MMEPASQEYLVGMSRMYRESFSHEESWKERPLVGDATVSRAINAQLTKRSSAATDRKEVLDSRRPHVHEMVDVDPLTSNNETVVLDQDADKSMKTGLDSRIHDLNNSQASVKIQDGDETPSKQPDENSKSIKDLR